ncbi:MAG: BTAD domain-containing putative transcriptional regulator [Ktedonobacterales bacterium]
MQVIEARRGSLQRSGRGATLTRWIELLPSAVRARCPGLQILQAELLRLAGRTAEAAGAVERVCAGVVPRAPIEPSLAARALAERADIYYIQGRYEDAQRDCALALRLAADDDDEVQVQARFVLAACLTSLSGPREARACLDGIEDRCRRLHDLWALARLYYVRSNLALAEGAFGVAEDEAVAGLRFSQEAGDEVCTLLCRLNLGGIRQYFGQLDQARRDLEAALAQAEDIGHQRAVAYALTNLADLALTAGSIASAIDLYDRAWQVAASMSDLHLSVCIASGWSMALCLLGCAPAALERILPLLDELTPTESPLDWALAATASAFAHYSTADLARATDLLEQVSGVTRQNGAQAEYARAQLILAAVHDAGAEMTAAARALGEAIETAAALDGTPRALLDARFLPALRPLLARHHHPLAAELLSQLVAEQEAAPRTDLAGAGEGITQPEETGVIRVFALGDARVLIGDNRITRWPRPRLRELLCFMLDRAEPVRRDVILDAIWPDKDPEAADDEFRKARSDLKKVLGGPWIAQQDGRWHLTITCWHDVRVFERLLVEGARLKHAGETRAAALQLRQAVSLWSAPYLDDVYSDWTILRRETLLRNYLDALEQLAGLELELRHYEYAAPLCYTILEAEPYRERAHRMLMSCFIARGELGRAVEQFTACTRALHMEDLAPSPQTIALYQAIQRKLHEGTRELARSHA